MSKIVEDLGTIEVFFPIIKDLKHLLPLEILSSACDLLSSEELEEIGFVAWAIWVSKSNFMMERKPGSEKGSYLGAIQFY